MIACKRIIELVSLWQLCYFKLHCTKVLLCLITASKVHNYNLQLHGTHCYFHTLNTWLCMTGDRCSEASHRHCGTLQGSHQLTAAGRENNTGGGEEHQLW